MGHVSEPRIWGDEAIFAAEIRRERKQETVIEDRFARVVIALVSVGLTEIVFAAFNLIGVTK